MDKVELLRLAEIEGASIVGHQSPRNKGTQAMTTENEMTEAERLAEQLHELLSRATSRPWDHFQSTLDPERYYISNGRHAIFASEIGATSQADLGLVVEAVNGLPTLLARIAELEDALSFYACESNWISSGFPMSMKYRASSAELDLGNKARLTLGKGSE